MICGQHIKVACQICVRGHRTKKCNHLSIVNLDDPGYNGYRGCLEVISRKGRRSSRIPDKINDSELIQVKLNPNNDKFILIEAKFVPKLNEWCPNSQNFRYECDYPCCKKKPKELYIDEKNSKFLRVPQYCNLNSIEDAKKIGTPVSYKELPTDFLNNDVNYHSIAKLYPDKSDQQKQFTEAIYERFVQGSLANNSTSPAQGFQYPSPVNPSPAFNNNQYILSHNEKQLTKPIEDRVVQGSSPNNSTLPQDSQSPCPEFQSPCPDFQTPSPVNSSPVLNNNLHILSHNAQMNYDSFFYFKPNPQSYYINDVPNQYHHNININDQGYYGDDLHFDTNNNLNVTSFCEKNFGQVLQEISSFENVNTDNSSNSFNQHYNQTPQKFYNPPVSHSTGYIHEQKDYVDDDYDDAEEDEDVDEEREKGNDGYDGNDDDIEEDDDSNEEDQEEKEGDYIKVTNTKGETVLSIAETYIKLLEYISSIGTGAPETCDYYISIRGIVKCEQRLGVPQSISYEVACGFKIPRYHWSNLHCHYFNIWLDQLAKYLDLTRSALPILEAYNVNGVTHNVNNGDPQVLKQSFITTPSNDNETSILDIDEYLCFSSETAKQY
ncbi:Helicase domino [Wickerhamomyces ciferrii]|uniref:Helicase domino n=1 Tax=Wickerhamomyces ciferrii (strain ATCC 14091 / BCRC 22168 / CBS 111 / JCM 3599 / NBRC 0793 / NRRL Y-1031 F-60-10) TaxID=1206466 RepID=K0KTC9_WICCF|nr:Helicase domino [Wickerhamomyces ciferrii]CCH46421.1 Helicase domino [Wickerhamomyces ciferrii]